MNTNTVSSANLLGVTSYEQASNAVTGPDNNMGKQDFLTLFTAQLKNQNPLDPVKNEAFVAQLAQFSQLEALNNMQTSMEGLANALSAERMLSSSTLIGRKVSVTDAMTPLTTGSGIDATIALDSGASGVQVNIFNAQGVPVQQLIAGAQLPGVLPVQWDGTDAAGNPVPTGFYRMTAQAVVNGQTVNLPVNTLVQVRSITTQPDGTVSLQLDGGKNVLLSDVTQVGL